jgi:hypothetical protein
MTINDLERRGDLANCIALHDFKIFQPDFKRWVEYIVAFLENYDLVPNRLGGHRKSARKNVTFKGGIKALEASNYDTDFIWIGALPLEYKSDTGDALFSSSISISLEYDKVIKLIFNDDIAPFDVGLVNKLALDLWNITKAQYGYFYQRSIYHGPLWYPSGVICGLSRDNPKEKRERAMITKWGNSRYPNATKNKYEIGRIRDIYPVNFLTQPHLERIVFDGQTLEQWIQASPDRGHLLQLDQEGFWSWAVEQDHIAAIYDALKNSGIIVCV